MLQRDVTKIREDRDGRVFPTGRIGRNASLGDQLYVSRGAVSPIRFDKDMTFDALQGCRLAGLQGTWFQRNLMHNSPAKRWASSL